MGYRGEFARLIIIDEQKEVWSWEDGDCIAWTPINEYEDAVKLLGKEVVDKWIASGFENIELNVQESFWENTKGYMGAKVYSVLTKKVYVEGKLEVVEIPLTLDASVSVPCPYCHYPRTVEPDADYKVKCENCGKPYKIASPI